MSIAFVNMTPLAMKWTVHGSYAQTIVNPQWVQAFQVITATKDQVTDFMLKPECTDTTPREPSAHVTVDYEKCFNSHYDDMQVEDCSEILPMDSCWSVAN
jgi:hypothetical protein